MQLPQLLKGAQLEERKCDEKSAAGGEHQYALRSAGSALAVLTVGGFSDSRCQQHAFEIESASASRIKTAAAMRSLEE
jgi:hypothetical protein